MGRPPTHDEVTAQRLLEAAARLLADEGVDAVSVRRVSQEAGTTTRAVYSLFGDKSGLLRRLYHDAAETLRRHHEEVPADHDPLVGITALALAYRRAALEHPHAYGLLMGPTPGFTPTEEDRFTGARAFRRVLDGIDRFIGSGTFAGPEARPLGLRLWAQVHGLTLLELQGLLGDPEEAEAQWRAAVAAHVQAFRTA
jgi:AcrR family transcriptional regulator